MAYKNGELAAIGAIKKPTDMYVENKFLKAKTPEPSKAFKNELGWMVTKKCFRNQGLCSAITELLLSETSLEKLFATTREENKPMQSILEQYGFRPSGISFKSKRGPYFLKLFIRKK
jgi:hypothetical protein